PPPRQAAAVVVLRPARGRVDETPPVAQFPQYASGTLMKHRAQIAAFAVVVLAAAYFGWRAWSRRYYLNTRIAERVTYDAPAPAAATSPGATSRRPDGRGTTPAPAPPRRSTATPSSPTAAGGT